jgi:hypothetical protein
MDINQIISQNLWIVAGITIFVAVHTIVKAVRDAIDKTPATDDNAFERVVTIMGKVAAYLAGIRAK